MIEPSFVVDGQKLANFAVPDYTLAKMDEEDCINMLHCFSFDEKQYPKAILPSPRVQRVVLIAGTDDQNLPALNNAVLLARQCTDCEVEICVFSKAGHLIVRRKHEENGTDRFL